MGQRIGTMIDKASRFLVLLRDRREVSLTEIADELHMSERGARKWVQAAERRMDIRLERGKVIVGE